jgi:4-hydroxy-tetrahydrodipicolinate synthase
METTGCGTAIVTPFKADGRVDQNALYALVNWQIDSGIDFLMVCGSTGEAATLDEEEWLDVIRTAVEVAAGRVPVWAGCTHNSTRALLRRAEKLARIRGLDAILSATPYYNRPTQEGLFRHFEALAAQVQPMPIVLYNVPGRTCVNLEPETVLRLAETASNVEAIKEASGRLAQISMLIHSMPQNFRIFVGDDNLALAAIGAGVHGLASVASNVIPAEMARMVGTALRGDWHTAREIERKYIRLFEANFWESNPGPVKTILSLMGRCQPTLRLPLVEPARGTQLRLERLAGELGLLRNAPLPEGDMRMF